MTLDTGLSRFIALFTVLGIVAAGVTFVDVSVMTEDEHNADVSQNMAVIQTTLAEIKQNTVKQNGRIARETIWSHFQTACENNRAISEIAQQVIEEWKVKYEESENREYPDPVCHEGKLLTRTDARMRGLIQ